MIPAADSTGNCFDFDFDIGFDIDSDFGFDIGFGSDIDFDIGFADYIVAADIEILLRTGVADTVVDYIELVHLAVWKNLDCYPSYYPVDYYLHSDCLYHSCCTSLPKSKFQTNFLD